MIYRLQASVGRSAQEDAERLIRNFELESLRDESRVRAAGPAVLPARCSLFAKFGTKKVAPKNAVYAEFTRLSVVFPVISAQKSACADEITILSINATQNDMMCACACGCGSSHIGQRWAWPLGVSCGLFRGPRS